MEAVVGLTEKRGTTTRLSRATLPAAMRKTISATNGKPGRPRSPLRQPASCRHGPMLRRPTPTNRHGLASCACARVRMHERSKRFSHSAPESVWAFSVSQRTCWRRKHVRASRREGAPNTE